MDCEGVACQPGQGGEGKGLGKGLDPRLPRLHLNHVISLIGSDFNLPKALCNAGLVLAYLYQEILGFPCGVSSTWRLMTQPHPCGRGFRDR